MQRSSFAWIIATNTVAFFLAQLPPSAAVCANLYDDTDTTCSNVVASDVCTRQGACKSVVAQNSASTLTGSGQITCAAESESSDWTLTVWIQKSSCDGAADVTHSGSGLGCVPIALNGDTQFNVEVNCTTYSTFNPSDRFIVVTFDADINALSSEERESIIESVRNDVLERARTFLGIQLFPGDIQIVIKEGSINVEVKFSADVASNVTDLAANIKSEPISITINGADISSSGAAVQTSSDDNSSGLTSGEIAGIVVGSIAFVAIVIIILSVVVGKKGDRSSKVAPSPTA
eukprot:m.330493 g.330493  ORF g.330493 m.330493 type:complete len:290 (-) comp20462_c0_seq3:126-995(-)